MREATQTPGQTRSEPPATPVDGFLVLSSDSSDVSVEFELFSSVRMEGEAVVIWVVVVVALVVVVVGGLVVVVAAVVVGAAFQRKTISYFSRIK